MCASKPSIDSFRILSAVCPPHLPVKTGACNFEDFVFAWFVSSPILVLATCFMGRLGVLRVQSCGPGT